MHDATIERTLLSLQRQLVDSELESLNVFTVSYRVVTRALEATPTDYFDDPAGAFQLDAAFVGYYVAAVEAGQIGQGLSSVWMPVFAACRANHSRLKILALSINAHVGADLVMSLQDIGAGREFRGDLWRKYRVIAGCAQQIIDEAGIGLGPTWFWQVEAVVIRLLMRWYTWLSWRRYRRLAHGRLTLERLQKLVARDGRWLARLPWPHL